MRKLIPLLLACAVMAGEPLYLPENKPVSFAWDHDRRLCSAATFYNFYSGTNLVQTVTNFTATATNASGVATIEAMITFPPALKGATNQLSVTAVEPKLTPPQESAGTTNLLPAQVLGKPSPPQDARKL